MRKRYWEISGVFFRFFLPLAILFLFISISFYFTENKSRRVAFRSQQSINIEKLESIIRHDIKAIVTDLTFISEQYSLFSNSDLRLINDAFLIFVRNKKIYDQLRFIDADGMERIRINWNNGEPIIISPSQLQDKSKRYYFLDTINLNRGEIFVSPFDLNIEHGEVEQPIKPMIRFATPVFNREGKKLGIVIINYLGDNLIQPLNILDDTSAGNTLLLNQEGFYLRGPKASYEWGFMFPNRTEHSFSRHYPNAWDKISAENNGQFTTHDGLFSFVTIHPLLEGLHSSTGSSEAYAESKARLSDNSYFWKLVSHVPQSMLHSHDHAYLNTYIGASLFLLFLIGAGSWFAADAIGNRRKAEEELRSEREKFRALADYTYDWEYWLGPQGNFVYTSPSSKRITGYGVEEFYQDPELLLKIIHPDDLQNIRDHFDVKHNEQDVCNIDFRIITATGEVRWIAHLCQAVHDDENRFLGRRASNRDISLRKQIELKLKEQATHDHLTSLPNRKLLYDRLIQILAQAQRAKRRFAILFIDLDKFKQINDELGHDAGDIVLKQTANRMTSILRQGDTVARIGGDEFIVILPDVDEESVVMQVCKKLIHAIDQAIELDHQGTKVERQVTASIGISIYPEDGKDADSLISAADSAMYLAKKRGRNQFSRLDKS